MRNSRTKFIFFAPGDIHVARVDRQCIVYACEALTRAGVDVELLALRIKLVKSELRSANPLDLYRCRTPPAVRLMKSGVRQESSAFWSALNRLVVHSFAASDYLRKHDRSGQLIFYTKNYASAASFLALRRLFGPALIIFEAHTVPHNPMQRLILRSMDGVIANSLALEGDLKPYVRPERMFGCHQGVDLEKYDELRISKEKAREKLGWDGAVKHVVYTGKVYWGYAEVENLLKAAEQLNPGIQLTIVGGRHDHADQYKKEVQRRGLRNVNMVGFVSPAEVQWYQLAADVLVSYYPGGMELNRYRSPGKLFEYMAAGRAIVAADYAALREVLDETSALFVPPDAPSELARELNALVVDEQRVALLGTQALAKVAAFTWDRRAQAIMSFIHSLPGRTAMPSDPLVACVQSQKS